MTSSRKRRSARKRFARDLVFEPAIGRGDDSRVHSSRQVLAHTPHLAILQDAQQLRLGPARQLSDFVEKDGAAIGFLEEARPLSHWRR